MSETQDTVLQEENLQKFQLTRKQRREQERSQIKEALSFKEQLERSIKRNRKLINDLTQLYCKSYNDYSELNKDRNNGLKRIGLDYAITSTQVSLIDLKKNSSTLDMSSLMQCVDPINPAAVNIFYLRVDFQMLYANDVEIEPVRPDVPEEIVDAHAPGGGGGKIKKQLFYHAIFPKPDDLKTTALKAEERLLTDFISHIFCSGIDMQHSTNNRLWDNKFRQQTNTIHDKGEEVMKIFEEAAAHKL